MVRAHTASVLEKIRGDIQNGKYCQAEFLPSERELAQNYGTGRGVIRTILRKLRTENLVCLIPGRGAKVIKTKKKLSLERFLVRFNGTIIFPKANEAMGILAGICAEAAENHAEVVMSFSDTAVFMNELASRHAKGDIQGLIFLEGWERKTMFSSLETVGIPYLVANQERDDSALCCRMDFRNIGRQAGRYLTARGHRHIGVVAGPLENYFYKEILAGFRGALAEDEISLAPENIIQPGENGQYPDLRQLLLAGSRPTAVFAMRDHRAMKFYSACRDFGVRIPEDISIISYDNITWPDAAHVGLTTLEQPVEEIGREAVEMLKEWIISGVKPPERNLRAKLIERGSVRDIR
ncbi:MAG: GntR family transcriptional regulator [Victivallaceae bacterium]|nr:GntR family transcriptional regulator [Victivallaceae bacterium]